MNLDDYIYINEKSISSELCFDIINLFEKTNNKYEGQTLSGLNKNIKNTLDFIIPHTDKNWKKIHKFLHNEITINLKKYIDKLNNLNEYNNINQDTNSIFKHFENFNFYYSHYQIQKYKANEGKYIYHDDFLINLKDNKYRIITFLWYLNNIDEGGETYFSGKYFIKPQTGKLVLFPATWTYPHSGKMPLSNDKYIITGWIYVNI